MTAHFPDAETMRAVLSLATMAPSVGNSQPWHWDVGPDKLHLYADMSRLSTRTDAVRRDVLLSCGAALHHCTVALAAMGWQAKIHRFPDSNADHLASIEVYPQQPADHDVALTAAITRRRTDRRDYTGGPVAVRDIAMMGARAARAGVMLRQIELLPMLTAVVAASVGMPYADSAGGFTFDRNVGSGRPDNAVILALGTESDDDLARLRAGEATSLVLLSATAMGLATCSVTEPLEVFETRDAVRADVFGTSGYPQMVLRVGWAATDAEPLPSTPRRLLTDVVSGLGTYAVLAGQAR